MLTPGNEMAELAAIRAAAVAAGYITLDESSADAWVELLNLPDSVIVVALTNYADPVRYPIEARFVDGSLDRHRAPAPATDAMQAELAALKAEARRRGLL